MTSRLTCFLAFLCFLVFLPVSVHAQPEMEYSPDGIETHLATGDVENYNLNIRNMGDDDLIFTIEHVIAEEPERDQDLRSINRSNSSDQLGPRRDDLGDEIAEFNIGEGTWSGLAWDGELMWGVRGEEGMVAFDPEAEEVVENINVNGFYIGMAYDGQSFWAGIFSDEDENARIQQFDREGNVNRTLNVRGNLVYGVAYDGENLWYYSMDWEEGTVIRQITTEGEQIREIDCTELFDGGALSLAWVPQHEDGNLWVIQCEEGRINQLDISEDDPGIIQEARINGEQVYGMEHDGENMWHCTFDNVWRVIDDGIRESNWLSYEPDEGVVEQDDETDVTVTIDATGLIQGYYEADIHIINNDPRNEDAVVNVQLNITGIPVFMVTWDEEFGFPDVIDWNQAYRDLFTGGEYPVVVTIYNDGTASLEIEEIYCENNVFRSDPEDLILEPNEETEVEFILQTEEDGLYEAEMIIVGNDPDEEEYIVNLRAETSAPPVIILEPVDIETNLNTGDIEQRDINVSNDGESVLRFTIDYEVIDEPGRDQNIRATRQLGGNIPIGPRRDDLGEVINEYNVGGGEWSGLAWDGELIWGISTRGSMLAYDPEAEEVVEEANLNDTYYGMAYDGEFFWVGTFGGDDMIARIHRIDRNGDVNQTINAQGMVVLGVAFDGENLWYYSLDFEREERVIRQISRDGEQLREIVIDNMFEGMIFSIEWVSEHEDGNLWVLGWETRILYQFDISGDDPQVLQQTQVNGEEMFGLAHDSENMWYCTVDNVWRVIDDGVAELSWLSCDPESGDVNSHSDMDVSLTIDCVGLLEGDYLAYIHFLSNDPETQDAAVIFNMHVTGAPVIEVKWDTEAGYPDVIDWNQAYLDVFTGVSYSVPVIIKNTGTTALEVEDIFSENEVFSSDQSEFVLDPNEEIEVNFTLETEDEGLHDAEMVINWNSPNDEDTIVPLIGRTSLPPVIVVDPADIEIELDAGCIEVQIFNIANDGSSTLRYTIENEIISQPEGDREALPGPRRDDFGDVINEYNVGGGMWSGLAWDGELMWGTCLEQRQFKLMAFDPETEEVVESTNLNNMYMGLTFDGEAFWGGFLGEEEGAMIQRFDRRGNVIQTINLGEGFIAGVTYDGENLWYYDGNQRNVVFHQITVEGAPIREVNCENIINEGTFSIAWVPEHNEGNLWALRWNRTLYQFDVSGDEPEIVQQTQVNQGDYFPIEHDGENLWYSSSNSVWYVIDDGISEIGWLSCDPKAGELEPNGDIDIDVTLSAVEAAEGEYEADVKILSNDPDDPIEIVNVLMIVGQSSVPAELALPDEYQLSTPYPNPFNAVTCIRYELPHLTKLSLQVYDIDGRLATTLFNGDKSAGYYSAVWNAESYPAGMYFIRLDTPDFSAVRKVVMVK
ncbi:T9SS type A sorting domain-containing protein [bacterium]|nr:T9SS type A sorting domain-containing protein [bacterium]